MTEIKVVTIPVEEFHSFMKNLREELVSEVKKQVHDEMQVRYYTLQEVAELVSVSYNTLYRMCRNNDINYKKFGNEYRIPHSELTQFSNKKTA